MPACTLELLGLPNTPENAERRLGAIAASRELLRQGLDVEALCQVQDWSCFLNQALNKLMATEIVELLGWDNLSTIRKNKKSLESQNQRAIIDFNCFYIVLIAHIALGFSSKQTDLVISFREHGFNSFFCFIMLGCGIYLVFFHLIRVNVSQTLMQITKAKDICKCLIASEGIDLKFEETFCAFLLGQVSFSFPFLYGTWDKAFLQFS